MEEHPTSNSSSILNQAILKTSTLISQSHTIKHPFTTKWLSIRTNLQTLQTSLTAIQNSQTLENLSLSITLDSILSTFNTCDDLALQCINLTFPGKLRMQSDLDILNSNLENHIKSLSQVYAEGLLTQSFAIVVPKPGVSASKEDVRFYVSDLISRLKIGGNVMKKEALVALNDVVLEDEKYLKAGMEICGFVNLIVDFLDGEEDFLVEIREEAVKFLWLVLKFGVGEYKRVLLNAGFVSPLIRVIENGSHLGKIFGLRCLLCVTENSDNAWSVSAHGGVTVLLKICKNLVGDNYELVALACGVLKNVVGVEEIKRFMIEERAINEFVKLVGCEDEVVRICCIDLLQCMGYRDDLVKEMIVEGGGIKALVGILDPKVKVSLKVREVAFKGIASLCFSNESVVKMLVDYGFMDHVLCFLKLGDVSVQELGLKAAFWLCGTSEEVKKLMGDSGFMPVLVKFLDSKSFEIREMAAETLSSMLSVVKNRKKFVQNDQNVVGLLQMLDPGEVNSGNKKLLLSILMSLANSNSARKKIMSSGYLKNIEMLAEAEVSDAKKIVRKLSCNRFQSIFSGFWHS